MLPSHVVMVSLTAITSSKAPGAEPPLLCRHLAPMTLAAGMGWLIVLAWASPGLAESTDPAISSVPSHEASTDTHPAATDTPSETDEDALPDGGPRTEPGLTEADLAALEPAQELIRSQQYDAAMWTLSRVAQQAGSPALAAMAKVLQAEVTYAQHPGSQERFEAITLYQALIREYPQAINASRAGWRVGDLYAERGWRVEAQAAYERAAKEAQTPADRARAFLGLGLMYGQRRQWRQAVDTLKGLRQEGLDDITRGWLFFGLAEGYYGLHRQSEAEELFVQLWERWPERIRRSPEAMQHMAEVLDRQGNAPLARQVRLAFHNLYPTHREAPRSLVLVGDSLRKAGLLKQAELMYAATIEQHADSDSAQQAKLRMAELGQEMAGEEASASLAMDIADQFTLDLRAPRSRSGQREIFTAISAAHPDKVVGSEALVRLAELDEAAGNTKQAQIHLQQACEREGRILGDEWPLLARRRLANLLRPELAAAIRQADDLHAVAVFHRFGTCPDWGIDHLDLLLHIAEAHRRLGFDAQAITLYQRVLGESQEPNLRQSTLVGLGRTYLSQRDAMAARLILDRYLLEYPLGERKGEVLQYLSEGGALAGDAAAVIKSVKRWFKWYGAQASNEPQYGPMLLRLAGAQAAVKQHDAAIRTLRLAEQAGVVPYVEARLREAQYWDEQGRAKAAVAQWAEVVRVDPRSQEASLARLHMARTWWQQRRWTETALVLDRASHQGDDELLRRAATVLNTAVQVERKIGKEKSS